MIRCVFVLRSCRRHWPARIERQQLLNEHALREPDGVRTVPEDESVVCRIPAERREADFFMEDL
jgi:hypothetical protein